MTIGSMRLAHSTLPAGSNAAVSSPSTRLFSTFLLTTALCLGALIRSVGPSFLRDCFQPIPIFDLSGLSALVVGLFGAVVLHEAGHFVAAAMADFEISAVVIGPFRVVRLGTSWTLVLKKYRLFEASVSAFPRTGKNWRQRMIAVVAAGPMATLITGLAAAFLFHLFGAGDSWFIWLLRAFAQVSFFISVLGLVPNHKSLPCQNDAALLRSLWCNDSQANEIFLYHLVLQQQRAGVSPRNYPLGLLQLLSDFEGRPDFMAFFATTLASWAFDSNDHQIGNAWDGRALDLSASCSSHSRNLVMVNSACFDIIYHQDLRAAQAKLAQLDLNRIVTPSLQYRARTAAHLVARRIPEALASIAAARFALPRHLQGSGIEYWYLGHLHATALNMQPDELCVMTQKPKMARPAQARLAMI